MHAESSVECGADDPVLVVPWSGFSERQPATQIHFIDLRENPYDLDRIAEAEQHPPLLQALRALNAPRSPVFTAKCDAWPMTSEDILATRYQLDVAESETPFGFASYIDLLFQERTLFVSLHHQQQRLDRLTRLLDPLDHPYALAELTLRPALVDLAGPQEGFAITLYVKALGTDPPHAYEHWGRALASIVSVLRSRELAT